jgi:hypothetical protein
VRGADEGSGTVAAARPGLRLRPQPRVKESTT